MTTSVLEEVLAERERQDAKWGEQIEELAEFIEACVKHGEASDEAWGELVQTVAVGVAMLEALARRRGHRAEEPRQKHSALSAQLAQVTAERDALRAIVEGRTTPPSDEEARAHIDAGGLWRWVATIDGDVARGLSGDACEAPRGGAFVGMPRRFASVYAETWWPLDAHGLPCAWPVVDR